MAGFIALPFPFPSKLKICSFHVVVKANKGTKKYDARAELFFCSLNPLVFNVPVAVVVVVSAVKLLNRKQTVHFYNAWCLSPGTREIPLFCVFGNISEVHISSRDSKIMYHPYNRVKWISPLVCHHCRTSIFSIERPPKMRRRSGQLQDRNRVLGCLFRED